MAKIIKREFYPNGKLERTFYDDGSLDYFDKQTGVRTEHHYPDGRFESYRADGSVYKRVSAGRTMVEFYDEAERLTMRRNGDGISECYYPSGALKSVFEYDGSGTEYYESGSIKAICPAYRDSCATQEFDDERSIQARCRQIKEELVAAVFHPCRVKKWLELGGQELLDMMFGA